MFRMEALARLATEFGSDSWMIPFGDGGYFAPEAVLKAAATEPLVEQGTLLVFNRESFLARALAHMRLPSFFTGRREAERAASSRSMRLAPSVYATRNTSTDSRRPRSIIGGMGSASMPA